MTKCSASVWKSDHMIHESTSLSQTTARAGYGWGQDYLQAVNLTQKQSCHDTRMFF